MCKNVDVDIGVVTIAIVVVLAQQTECDQFPDNEVIKQSSNGK